MEVGTAFDPAREAVLCTLPCYFTLSAITAALIGIYSLF